MSSATSRGSVFAALALAALVGMSRAQESAPQSLTAAPDKRVELDLQHYYGNGELAATLEALAKAYPEFLRVDSLGASRDENPIWLATLGDARVGELARRPALAIVTGLSERDACGPELALSAIYELLKNNGRDPAAREVLENAVVYAVLCVDPDRRDRLLATSGAAQAPSAPRAARLELDFPAGWSPWGEGVGPYPLAEPETRALVEFLSSRERVRIVLGAGDTPSASTPRGDLTGDLREFDARVLARVGARDGALELHAGSLLERRAGSLAEYVQAELGALFFEAQVNGGKLVPPSDLYDLGRRFALDARELARCLPRYALSNATRERLKSNLWKVEIEVANSGLLPSGDDQNPSAARSRLVVGGARVVAAALQRVADGAFESLGTASTNLAIGSLRSGANLRVRLIIEAEAATTLALALEASGGGSAALEVRLE